MRRNFILPIFLIGTWNPVVASGARISSKSLVHSLIFFTSDFRNLSVCRASVAHSSFRANHRNQIPQSKLSDWKLHVILQRLVFCGKVMAWCSMPQKASPSLEEAKTDCHRGPEQEGGQREERAAAGREPQRSCSSRSECTQTWEAEARWKHALRGGRGWEWLGEGLWAQSPVRVASAWSPQAHSLGLMEEVQVVAAA